MKQKEKYIDTLKVFAMKISHYNKDPLDGDQTELLSQMFNIELDFQSGNITLKEYNEKYRELKMEIL